MRRTPLPATVAGLLLALLVLTGCGGGDEEPKDSGLGPVSDETSRDVRAMFSVTN